MNLLAQMSLDLPGAPSLDPGAFAVAISPYSGQTISRSFYPSWSLAEASALLSSSLSGSAYAIAPGRFAIFRNGARVEHLNPRAE